jgi:putative tryptophan/tyrosine transport system substrate-binding protein
MDRRTFVTLVTGALLIEPLAVSAQPGKVYRIGFLRVGIAPIPQAFWDAMRDFGWVEAQNVKIAPRYADREDQLPVLAAELVQIKVDLIMTAGTLAALAAQQATKTIPIVFSVGSDPVERGLVANLARPGGNLTGFVYGLYEQKLLQILKEALPGASRVALPVLQYAEPETLRAAKAFGVQMQVIFIKGPEDFGPFYTAARKAHADAVLIPDIAWPFGVQLDQLGAEATKNHLPAISWDRKFADSGGLLSYGPVRVQHWPRLAAQVDKIFKGAKPGDLPVEQPTKFEFVINLKTAKALAITISQSLLLRADEVIQ